MKKQLVIAVLCSCVGVLHADVVFTPGNNPNLLTDEHNVQADMGQTCASGLPAGTPCTVEGRVEPASLFPGTTVNFSSSGEAIFNTANEQAQVAGCSAPCSTTSAPVPLNNLTIQLRENTTTAETYGDLIFNANVTADCISPKCDGTVDVHVLATTGIGATEFSDTLSLGEGAHFLTITTTGGEKIIQTEIVGANGALFSDLRQVSISELSVTAIPEPSTYAPLMAVALGAISLFSRSRKKRKV